MHRRAGGTAIVWLKALGRGHAIDLAETRVCARSWPFGTIASVYGPADRPDLPWFSSTLERFEGLHASVLVGDFNWRQAYQRFLPSAWTCSKHFPTTVGGAAGPTRLLSYMRASPEAPCEVTPLPGIPHHLATL